MYSRYVPFAECVSVLLFFVPVAFGRGDAVSSPDREATTPLDSTFDHQYYPTCPEWPTVVTCTDYLDPGYTQRLEDAEDEIDRLRRHISEYNATVTELHRHVEVVESQLNTTQGILEGVLDGTVIITVAELELVQEQLKDMSRLLKRVEAVAADIPEVQLLREELDNLTRVINDLQLSNPTEVRILQKQVKELRKKLENCEKYYTNDDDDGLFQPWNEFPTQDSCRDIIRVSEPFTVRGRGSRSGSWFRDPVLNYTLVWYSPFHNSRYTFQVDRFANVADFTRGTRYESRYVLPRSASSQGTGMVAYNGSLYYNADRSRQLIRYDIANRTVVAVMELPDAMINNRGAYTSEGYTDIDLAVDEVGLWAIYTLTTDQSSTCIDRLDPETLEVQSRFLAASPKFLTGNCFMICAKMYCIGNHFSHDTTVDFVYDTATDELRELGIPFDVRFGEMMALDYNPRDQKLYGWDNGHQVVYDITFDPENEASGTTHVLPLDDGVLLGLQ